MLHDPARHEALTATPWNEGRALDVIERIVCDAEARFSPEGWWPSHPRDEVPPEVAAQPATPLYMGGAGMVWALRYLRDAGAAALRRDESYPDTDELLRRNGEWLQAAGPPGYGAGSYLCGDTSILLMAYGVEANEALADRLAALIEGHVAHPTRELMWGSPGTLLAARFLHERDGRMRWADLFRRTAAQLWSELQWSEGHSCHYWTQDLYGQRSTFLDAAHGFAATASVLVHGRHLLDDVIRLCGGRNVFATLRPLVPAVSVEAVVEADPEAIVTTRNDASNAGDDGLDTWRALKRMRATAQGNLVVLDADSIHRSSPRILDGADALCQALEGVRSRRPVPGR